MPKIITATLHNISPVPAGSFYRGDGMFEFVVKTEPNTIVNKFAEYDTEKNSYYKDPKVKIELAADLMVAEKEKTGKVDKDGKPVKK